MRSMWPRSFGPSAPKVSVQPFGLSKTAWWWTKYAAAAAAAMKTRARIAKYACSGQLPDRRVLAGAATPLICSTDNCPPRENVGRCHKVETLVSFGNRAGCIEQPAPKERLDAERMRAAGRQAGGGNELVARADQLEDAVHVGAEAQPRHRQSGDRDAVRQVTHGEAGVVHHAAAG